MRHAGNRIELLSTIVPEGFCTMNRRPLRTNEMKYMLLAALTVLAAGTVASAYAETVHSSQFALQPVHAGVLSEPAASSVNLQHGRNAASLNALLVEWHQAGFITPSKPAQSHVYGHNGYETSGPGYYTMISLIRSAENDARQGRERDETASIAEAQSLLTGTETLTTAGAHQAKSNGRV
jgi:hypothetical protein